MACSSSADWPKMGAVIPRARQTAKTAYAFHHIVDSSLVVMMSSRPYDLHCVQISKSADLRNNCAKRRDCLAQLVALQIISTHPITCRCPNETFHVQSEPQAGSGQVPGRAGGYPTGPPTVPDVSNSLIRFVSILTALAVRITSRLTRPPGAELGCPSPVAGNLLRRLVGSKSFPSLLPAPRSARLRLPSGGS